MDPVQFQKSLHRQKLQDFLETETGVNFLYALSRLCPQRKITIPAGLAIQTGLHTELSALKLSEVSGFETCQKAIMLLASIPDERKSVKQEPTYSEAQRQPAK